MSSKAVKKAPAVTVKAPAKPKVAAKTTPAKAPAKPKAPAGGKKKANPKNAAKNAEAAVKKKAEQQRYAEALASAAERGLVTIFDELTTTTAQDKWTTAVGLHILETINNIQQSELRKDGDYNPYPAKNFLLFEDKVGASGKKKAPVKSGKSEASSSAPKKKKAPLKRGAKPAVEEPEEEVEVDVHLEDTHDSEDVSVEDPAPSEENKGEKKRNITTFTRDAKNYLGFLVMRFVDDYFSSQGGKGVKNREDVTNFTYTGVTKDINSHVSRAVVTTVNRMNSLVSSLPDRGVPDELNKLVGAHLQERPALMKFMGEYLSDYLKLVGYTLAQQLWVSRKVINQQAVEAVVRMLDMGNHEILVENKVITENESDYGIACGFYQDAHVFSELTVPKPPKKPKAPGSKGGKGSKKDKTKASAEAEENADGDAENAEADVEADVEAEADDDADDAEADDAEEAEENADVDTEANDADDVEAEEIADDAEPEPEPEPEPAPAPKKPLKKLK